MLEVLGGMMWLHSPTEESVCLYPDSEEYEEKLKSDKWFSSSKEAKEQVQSLDNATDEEIRELAKEAGLKNHWNAKIEKLKSKLKEIK